MSILTPVILCCEKFTFLLPGGLLTTVLHLAAPFCDVLRSDNPCKAIQDCRSQAPAQDVREDRACGVPCRLWSVFLLLGSVHIRSVHFECAQLVPLPGVVERCGIAAANKLNKPLNCDVFINHIQIKIVESISPLLLF